jgi:hypothetical protein
MKFIKTILIALFVLASFQFTAKAQEIASIKIVSQEKPTPFYSHEGLVDRKVNFRLNNNSDKPIIVYGTKYEGKLVPGGYFLKYDESFSDWKYPTRDNKPLEWKKVSSSEKDSIVLCAKDYLDFDVLFSSENDRNIRFKITAYVSLEKDGKPIEIISDEFKIEN